ncbi:1D-myo-inositol 2-acetamido-2-deoxy-alpha-D-glucopyranoside deacetylase [Planctomycetes bacterium Pan216]|uniref:1D-myo-inositol 2-acetamido-2-deoxy-alpha-D-glucopyranoside deacetylase n=1 Tax=Kolteria novifilia TaxID=2527975 RepID=A0A518B707_9BACT|nr:1D-myo-inositol 2-acetamido-2-deoxy-alpha-D-glucopyranoside deacetylase [Planctomycetes bacterium Pan216]
MTERLDVVAIAPHPDDLEITCGGTLAKLVNQGYRVGMFDLTTGEPTPRGTLETRAAEAETAREILGVQVRLNLGLPNRVLMDSPENRYIVATALRKYRPDIILTMAGRTPAASPDHHQGHLLVEASRFYSQLTKWDERFEGTTPYRVPHLVYAPVIFDAENRDWHSSFVVDISDTFEQKLAAIECYKSQFDEKRFAKVKHWVSGNAAATGGRSGFLFGELFTLPHPAGTEDLIRFVRGGKGSPAPVKLPGEDMPHG